MIVGAAVIFAGAGSLAAAQSPAFPPPPAPAAQEPPPSDTIGLAAAKATFQGLCSKCHDLGQATSETHDRAGWKEVIDRMSGFGLAASDDEVKQVLDYLVANQSASK